jgi:beta-glucuronidase
MTIPRRASRQLFASVRIGNPRLWEPGDPDLYPVRATVRQGRRSLGSYTTHVGVRSLKVTSRGQLLLNGRRVRLRGAGLHEDHPVAGAAMSPGQRAENFTLLRELGATVTRAHYPLHPDFYERADRAGVLIWNQIPVYRVNNDTMKVAAYRRKALRYLETTIRRDQSHPSVLVWSIANELSPQVSVGQRRYIQDAVALVRRLDPTGLAALDVVGAPLAPPVDSYTTLDALGVNSYFGWYRGTNGQTADRSLLGPYLDQAHEFYPTLALFVTEFGAEANRSGPADEKGTYEFQTEFMRYHVETYDGKSYLNGAIAWTLRDFKVNPNWEGGNPKPAPPVFFKGLVDQFGGKKPAFETTAGLFRAAGARRSRRSPQRGASR